MATDYKQIYNNPGPTGIQLNLFLGGNKSNWLNNNYIKRTLVIGKIKREIFNTYPDIGNYFSNDWFVNDYNSIHYVSYNGSPISYGFYVLMYIINSILYPSLSGIDVTIFDDTTNTGLANEIITSLDVVTDDIYLQTLYPMFIDACIDGGAAIEDRIAAVRKESVIITKTTIAEQITIRFKIPDKTYIIPTDYTLANDVLNHIRNMDLSLSHDDLTAGYYNEFGVKTYLFSEGVVCGPVKFSDVENRVIDTIGARDIDISNNLESFSNMNLSLLSDTTTMSFVEHDETKYPLYKFDNVFATSYVEDYVIQATNAGYPVHSEIFFTVSENAFKGSPVFNGYTIFGWSGTGYTLPIVDQFFKTDKLNSYGGINGSNYDANYSTSTYQPVKIVNYLYGIFKLQADLPSLASGNSNIEDILVGVRVLNDNIQIIIKGIIVEEQYISGGIRHIYGDISTGVRYSLNDINAKVAITYINGIVVGYIPIDADGSEILQYLTGDVNGTGVLEAEGCLNTYMTKQGFYIHTPGITQSVRLRPNLIKWNPIPMFTFPTSTITTCDIPDILNNYEGMY